MKPCAFGHPVSLARLEQRIDVAQAMPDRRADSCLVLSMQGVSSVLDAVSRTVEPKPGELVEKSSPPSASRDDLSEAADRAETHDDSEEGPKSKTHTARDRGQGASHSSRSSSSSPDPFDRISNMARSSLAGSLKLVSAATRGVGDAVFQAGTVAEDLAGGTGQVAGETGRRLCCAASWRPAPGDTVSCFIIHSVVKPTPI